MALAADIEVPATPGYLQGVLDNGLHYSIRANDRLEDRMVVYLGVNAGSLQEEEDQRGLAHFLEHMAFNGSEHFPGNSVVDFARENGMAFGAHVNAYTSFAETVYNFALPSNKPEVLEKSLLVLYDWLNALSIEPEEVEKERGVVLNEWRGTLGFTERYLDAWYPVLFEGSKFAQRLPIGLPEVIQEAPAQRLRDYYEKWYNTQNAMIAVVGDFDVEEMQRRVVEVFSPIEPRGQVVSSGLGRDWEEVPLRQAEQGPNGEMQAAVRAVTLQDDEAPGREISIAIKKGPRLALPTTVETLRQLFVLGLVGLVANQRFSDVVKSHSEVLWNMTGFDGTGIGSTTLYEFAVQGQQGQLQQAYQLLLQSMAQLKKYGVLQSEMDRAIDTQRSNLDVEYNNRNKRDNEEWASSALYQFLGSEYDMDISWLYENYDGVAAGVTLEQLNQQIQAILNSSDVSILASGKDAAELPSEEQLIQGYLGLDQLEVAEPQEANLPEQLLQNKPQAGKIMAEERFDNTGYVHWTLSNGLQVYFKHTEFEENMLGYSAIRSGGLFALEDESGDKYGPGSLVNSLLNNVVRSSGFAGLSPEQFERYMATRQLDISWNFDINAVSLSGNCDLGDVEELFQQIYLSFTAPQFSQKLIDQTLKDLKTNYDDMLSDPGSHFSYLARQSLYQNDPRVLPTKPEDMPAYRASELQEVFSKLIPSADKFSFVLVGNIEEDQLKGFVEQYLASLPTEQQAELRTDLLHLYPEGGSKSYALAPEGKAESLIVWDGYIEPERFPDSEDYRLGQVAELLDSLLSIRVTKVLREEMGQTYSPYAAITFERIPHNRIISLFYYSSAPEDIEILYQTVNKILAKVKQGQIDDNEFQQVKEEQVKSFEDNLQRNGYWNYIMRDALLAGYKNIDEMLSEQKFHEVLDSIDKQDLADFARKYITDERRMRYTMLPKK